MYRNIDFKAEYDFAGGGVGIRNLWIAFKACRAGRC